jgi:hypothetical protein
MNRGEAEEEKRSTKAGPGYGGGRKLFVPESIKFSRKRLCCRVRGSVGNFPTRSWNLEIIGRLKRKCKIRPGVVNFAVGGKRMVEGEDG